MRIASDGVDSEYLSATFEKVVGLKAEVIYQTTGASGETMGT